MTICCALLLAPLALFLLNGGAVSEVSGNLAVLLPLALCLALHVVMHRVTAGRSCHRSPVPAEDMRGRAGFAAGHGRARTAHSTGARI